MRGGEEGSEDGNSCGGGCCTGNCLSSSFDPFLSRTLAHDTSGSALVITFILVPRRNSHEGKRDGRESPNAWQEQVLENSLDEATRTIMSQASDDDDDNDDDAADV